MSPRRDNALREQGEVGALQNTHQHYKRLPAYGKQLSAMRRVGRSPAKMIYVTFDWGLARAHPRIVIADDAIPAELNFNYLAGLPVQIVYRSKDAHKIHAVVEEILQVNPCFLATFAVDRAGEDGARVLLIPFVAMKEAA
ncbi:MAG: hypothetical protein D4R40_02095 [Nitrosomonadaceae bacterium]|nr:MAG: hypothetical protein D4R40_02095 [Nitrosomonadaceae bacterium]